jgi:uncharacterized membrane protein
VSTYDWLLGIHVLGALALLGGAVAASGFLIAAIRSERPSEIALLLKLGQVSSGAVNAGALVALVFGLWLAEHADYGIGDEWVVAALVLWVVSMALGGIGGGRTRRAREEAERLAREGDRSSPSLQALLRDRTTMLLHWGSGVAVLAILVLMIWKPGAH